MTPEEIERIIRENIAEVFHMSLATSSEDKPWVCELHFAYDDDLNLYFISLPSRRHSIEISANPYVSGNIVRQYALDAQNILGVYFEGQCRILSNESERSHAFEFLKNRINLPDSRLKEASNPAEHQFYKITVNKWHIFGKLTKDHGEKFTIDWQ